MSSCITWPGVKTTNGYGEITIRGTRILAHRLAWIVYNEEVIPDGMEISHSCDNPICVNPLHLQVCTHKSNIRESVKRCRAKRYASEELISNIKADHDAGLSERAIATKYGRHRSSINRILSGRAYV